MAASKPTEFIPVRIGTLRPREPVSFDVFIKIGDRHVHYIRKEDPFDGERITALKAKGVKKLFVPRDSEDNYLTYLENGLNQLKDNQINLAEKSEIARDGMVTAAEGASERIQTEVGYKKTETQVGKVIEFLMAEKGAMRQMLASADVSADVSQHSANVVTLAVKLAAKRGLSETDITNVGIAALLHDIGKEDLGLDFSIPREKLTSEQIIIYQKHPELAHNKIFDKPYINKVILDLILNHEEVGEGAGFPNKKRLSTLSPAQQVLNVCNEYDRMCTVNKVKPLEAMKQFYIDKLGLFNMDILKSLGEIIKA